MNNKIRKALYSILGLKILLSILSCFTYFKGPHIIRQVDTLSISMKYYFNIFLTEHLGLNSFLPMLLSAGDNQGITAMEFPLINLLLSPFFYLGPYWGRICARLIFVMISILLSLWNYKLWKRKKYYGIDFGDAALILPIVSVSSLYFEKMMPDYMAFILVSLSVALSMKANKKSFFCFVFASLGLLIKPTSVIALGTLLLIRPNKSVLKEIITWIVPAFIICIFYYTCGIDYLESKMDMTPYFKVGFRDPIAAFLQFFSRPKAILKLINKMIFTPYVFYCFLGWELFQRFINKKNGFPLCLWAMLIFQMITIIVLDGEHIFAHSYYMLSLSFVASLFYIHFFSVASQKMASVVLIATIFLNVESFIHRLKPFFRENIFYQCEQILANVNIPYGSKIRSDNLISPEIGLGIGATQNSFTARFGVYYKDRGFKGQSGVKVFETKDLVVYDFFKERFDR